MAEYEMYDYVSAVTPDYDVTLDVSPQDVLTEDGSKSQVIHEADDGSEERISLGDDASVFYVTLMWKRKDSEDIATIFDWWHDTSKANGRVRSFKWNHPTDGHTYVVRFASNAPRSIYGPSAFGHGIGTVTLRVLGRIDD